MSSLLKSPAVIAAFAVMAGLTVPASARFIQPDEVVTEPGLKASTEKLKTLKEAKDAELGTSVICRGCLPSATLALSVSSVI